MATNIQPPASSAMSPSHLLAIIIAAGLLLRCIWAITIPLVPVSDSFAYDSFARTLVSHGVYGWSAEEPSAYWPVGTAAIVAATYWCFGDTYAGVVALNLVASVMTMYFVFRLGEAYFGTAAGLGASAIIAFWPNLIMFTTILSSELYFIALTVMGLYFWERSVGAKWINWVACGACWAAACYIRPVILLLPFALILAGVPNGWRAVATLGVKATTITLIVVLIVSPWTYRNYLLLGEPVLVSTNFGPNLWMGNNAEATGGYMELPADVDGISETERARVLGDRAKQYILNNRYEFMKRTVVKAVKLHDRETIGVFWNEKSLSANFGSRGVTVLKILSTGYWYFVLFAALCGLVLLYQRGGVGKLLQPPLIAWAYFTLLHAVIVVEDRYHMPSTPFIALLGGIALTHLIERRRLSRQAIPSGC